jgi:hypothetical protein
MMNIGIVELLFVLISGIILIIIPAVVIIATLFFNNRLNKLEARLTSLEQRDR